MGVRHLLVTDAQRPDILDAGRPRQWLVHLYYRARATPLAASDVYAADAQLLDRMIEGGYYETEAEALRSWARLPAPAAENAAPSGESTPLILLSPGSGVAAFNYALLAADLVGRGYAVAVVDHPYLGVSRLPDGRMLDAGEDPAQASEDPAALTPRVLEWSGDLSVTLDRLAALAELGLDLERVLAVGHSTGGAIALDACAVEARIDACMNFEGALFGSRAETQGVARPALATGSRARGRPRTASLGEPMIAALSQAGVQSVWYLRVTGGSHMSFSDAPVVMPHTLTRFGGEVVSAERSFELYAGLVDAFARAYLEEDGGGGAGDDAAFEPLLAQFPEVEYLSAAGRAASKSPSPMSPH